MITKQLLSLSSLAVIGITGACTLDENVEGEAADEPAFGEVEQNTICGTTDDSQFVNSYNGTLGPTIAFVTANKASKGALESTNTANSSKYCSGTLISANTFLTAGHCVDSSTVGDYVSFNYERAAGSTTLLTQDHYRVDAILEDALGGVDYAIVRLAGSPGTKWGIATVATADPAVGDHHRPPAGQAEDDRGRHHQLVLRQQHPLRQHRHARRQLGLGHPRLLGPRDRRPHQRRMHRERRPQLRHAHLARPRRLVAAVVASCAVASASRRHRVGIVGIAAPSSPGAAPPRILLESPRPMTRCAEEGPTLYRALQRPNSDRLQHIGLGAS